MELKDLRYIPRQIKQGIKNLFCWFPIIWNDRNWDHYYFFKILHFKLSNMEKYLREYGMHIRGEQDANDIRKCILTLNRIIEDDYTSNVFKHHDEKWGDIEISFKEIPGNDELFEELLLTRTNTITEEDKKREKIASKHLYKKSAELEKQDLDYLFSMLNKHVKKWWD